MIKTIIPAILIALIISTLGNVEAKTKSADEWLRENEKMAEDNPDSFIEKAYLGANIIVNDAGEFEVASIMLGSPAEKAGIKTGDVVIEIDGEKIKSRHQAFKIYFSKLPNDFVSAKIKRGNKLIKKTFQLGSFHVLYMNYVLMELIYKEIPVRLAVFVDEFKSEKMSEQDAERLKNSIASYWIGSFESSFIRAYRGHSNFAIVDRAKIKAVSNELSLQGSGLVAENSKFGRILGATHLFSINATIFESTKKMYLVMRLIEVESGKVIAAASLKQKLDGDTQANEMKQYLLKYYKELSNLFTYKNDAIDAYEGAVGRNYKSDDALYLTLINFVILKYEIYVRGLQDISSQVDEIKNVHVMNIESANAQLEGFKYVKLGIEKQDRRIMDQANEKLQLGRKIFLEYMAKRTELFNKYGIVLK
jgi:hypothetical protein